MATQQFPRDEIMTAYEGIVAAGDAGDWNRWADLHTVDCVWNEHNYGVIEGRGVDTEPLLPKRIP